MMKIRTIALGISALLVGGTFWALGMSKRPKPDPYEAIPVVEEASESAASTSDRTLSAEQRGGEAYWLLPAPRELSPTVFGTPDNPKRLVEPYVEQARELVKQKKMPPSVPDLIDPHGPKHGLPLLVGLPLDGPWGRTVVNGKWVMKHGSPFGDKMKPLKGSDHMVRVTFHDRQRTDRKGKTFLDTEDDVEFEAKFSDPQGNTYEITIAKVFKPPIPGWNTQGGVLMDSEMCGNTGTFIPLIPRNYAYAAVWGIGKISVNGKAPATRVTVFYVTEDIRDETGHLALDEEMPLNPRGVQAHLLVPPIEPVPGMGPTKNPVPTAFKLPPKAPFEFQPFICVYFPEVQITDGDQYVRAFSR